MPAKVVLLAAVLLAAPGIRAAAAAEADLVETINAPLDRLSQRLALETEDGSFALAASGLADLEGYWIDERPPGLLFGGDDSFLNPRLSLFVNARLGERLSSFVQVRVDRGFDPRADRASARADEYWLRFAPLADDRVRLQAGKFATVVGNWVDRHFSWDNPLINAPVPYENVTIVSDGTAPASPPAFLARREVPDRKAEWLPVVWGPAYTTGAAVSGRIGPFALLQYAVEVKNASVSSRPTQWDGRHHAFDHPTVAARLGVHPLSSLTVGASFARGPYLLDSARPTLPAGTHVSDFEQTLVGVDASFAWQRLELWSEVFLNRFEVPNVEDADSLAYYLEGRWKLTEVLFAALRWNQQFFGEVADGAGGRLRWDRDLWRIDLGLGARLGDHWQAKVQYGFAHQNGLQQGEQLAAFQLTMKF